MKISTYNKRRKKINECKALLMMYIKNADKLIKSHDPLLTIAPNFKMYFNYLRDLYRSKKYKQFYYLIHMKEIDKKYGK